MTVIPEVPVPSAAEAAHRIAREVRAAVETLPGLIFITTDERTRISVSASVPDRFLEICATAMDENSTLAAASKISAAEMRAVVITSQAKLALADELERLARGVRDSAMVERAVGGTEGLRVYSVARSLTRPRDVESSVSRLIQLQRTLNSNRLGSRAPAAPPEPVPALPALPALPAGGAQ